LVRARLRDSNSRGPPSTAQQKSLSYRFTGQREEATIALYFYNARWYDPALGRFAQPDVLVQADAKNPTPCLPLAVSYANPKTLEQWNQIQREQPHEDTQGRGAPPVWDPQSLNRYAYTLNNPLSYVDPGGNFALPIPLVTGIIGAVAGGLGYAASTALTGQNFNIKDFAVATGVGFVAGAAAPVVAAKTAGALILGAAANVTQYIVTQAVNDKPITLRDAAIAAGAGLVGGAIAGPYTANALRASVDLAAARMVAPKFYKEISRQILWEDVRLGLGNLVRSAGGSFAANTLPTLVEPNAALSIPSTGSTEVIHVPAGGLIPW